jgi:hypothetical protein
MRMTLALTQSHLIPTVVWGPCRQPALFGFKASSATSELCDLARALDFSVPRFLNYKSKPMKHKPAGRRCSRL